MNKPTSITAGDALRQSLSASDFLLDADAFVQRCVAAYAGDQPEITAPERAALADAIRAGRPRIEVVEAVRRHFAPLQFHSDRPKVNGVARDWSEFAATDVLERFAPDDDEAFIRQVYEQLLARPPSPIEAIENKFDLKGNLGRRDLITRIASRSPGCRLSTEPAPIGVGGGIGVDSKLFFNVIDQVPGKGWLVARDIWVQPGLGKSTETRDGAMKLDEGWVITGPKRSFPAGVWQLAINFVQPEMANLVIDVVANRGLDVLLKLSIAGAVQLVTPFCVEPWHNFVEVRLLKPVEEEQYRWLKIRQLVLRQS